MRFTIRHCIYVLLLVCTIVDVRGQECSHYFEDGGVCVNYISRIDYVSHENGQDVSSIELSLGNLSIAQGLSTLKDDTILDSCVQAFTSFVCATAFIKCKVTDSNTVLDLPCQSTCTKVLDPCVNNIDSASPDIQNIIKTYIQSSKYFPQDCNGNIGTSPPLDIKYPKEECNSSPQISFRPKCFSPLIEDHVWVESNKSKTIVENLCLNGCCLPCPQSYALYPEDKMEDGFLITQILRAISAVGSAVMLISYLVLPGKRNHPSILILFASLSIFLYSSNVFFSIGNPKAVQCENEVIASTQTNKPFLCGFQGALLIFASHATTLWVGVIILNLHIHTVWNSNILSNRYYYIYAICWGIPLILTVVALASHSVSYQFATLCFIRVDMANNIFFYPMAIFVIPSFFLHIATFVHIFKISQEEEVKNSDELMTHRRHVLQAIRIQWRALLLAIILLTTVIFYWLFYFLELTTISRGATNREFLKDWLPCIQSGKGQTFCANNFASKYMPRFGLMFAAETLTSLTGIYLIAIFFNNALWREWKNWFSDKFVSSRKLENSNPDQFLAL
ncbi:2307_t:CDS:2 [Funneliformis mosseae]|uniref:2307_t:CDS:1 n=1 Tax=Funneliformis mosseae TaxID=27381 RepID=A0A9N8VWB6_FUNMO|nr:2307_t:CDS:2 [Funneliformis mosseae]